MRYDGGRILMVRSDVRKGYDFYGDYLSMKTLNVSRWDRTLIS